MDFARHGRVTVRHAGSVASMLLLFAVCLARPGGMAFAQPAAAVSLNPAQGRVGTNVVATASGFTPGDTLTLIWSGNGAFLANAMADANGNATIQITIPDSNNGQFQVQVQSRFGQAASATFTVTTAQAAALSLNPAQAAVGTNIVATASGFAPGEMLSLFVFPNGKVHGAWPRTYRSPHLKASSTSAWVCRIGATATCAGGTSGWPRADR